MRSCSMPVCIQTTASRRSSPTYLELVDSPEYIAGVFCGVLAQAPSRAAMQTTMTLWQRMRISLMIARVRCHLAAKHAIRIGGVAEHGGNHDRCADQHETLRRRRR